MPATIKTMLMMTSALSASPNISVDSAKPPIGVKLNTCVCDDRHQRRILADRSAGEPASPVSMIAPTGTMLTASCQTVWTQNGERNRSFR